MNLPARIDTARLPEAYESAQMALANCAKIDECKDWADKAEALASYARQSEDDTLLKYAQRIKARAIRRTGELFKMIEPSKGGRPPETKAAGGLSLSRKGAAEEAGISERQMKNSIRVANIPQQEFDDAVDSENPPTVSKLADAGTKKRNIIDLNGRDPKEYNLVLHFIGDLRLFENQFRKNHPDIPSICAMMTDEEKAKARGLIEQIDMLADEISTRL